MKAGEEHLIIVEFDFDTYSEEEFPRDWSIVVWGEKGPVSLTHIKGEKSDRMPVVAKPVNSVYRNPSTGVSAPVVNNKWLDFVNWVEAW